MDAIYMVFVVENNKPIAQSLTIAPIEQIMLVYYHVEIAIDYVRIIELNYIVWAMLQHWVLMLLFVSLKEQIQVLLRNKKVN